MGRVFFNTRKNCHSITGDYQCLASDSGKTFFNKVAAGPTVTLPAIADAQEGWNCKIIISTNVTSGNFTITEKAASDTDKIILQTTENDVSAGAAPAGTSTGCTNVILASGADVIGDSFDIICDGTSWFVKANVNADAAVTVS
jgi:hypothetical protein